MKFKVADKRTSVGWQTAFILKSGSDENTFWKQLRKRKEDEDGNSCRTNFTLFGRTHQKKTGRMGKREKEKDENDLERKK